MAYCKHQLGRGWYVLQACSSSQQSQYRVVCFWLLDFADEFAGESCQSCCRPTFHGTMCLADVLGRHAYF